MFVIFGGAFWLIFHTLSPTLPSHRHPICIYSNQLRDDLKLILIRALERAERSIYLQIYALTDPDMKELLKRKSQEGVAVTLFYDENASPHLLEELTPYGVSAHPVHCTGLMHRKIFVVDEQVVFLGSVNLTSQSLKMHDNILMGFWNAELAHFCISSSQAIGKFAIGPLQLILYLLPEAREEALSTLLFTLKEAKSRINAALFTFTHPQILEALIQAKQRCVELNIAMDYYSKRGASRLAALTLQKNGISILESLGQQLLHHKWALVDQSTLIMGSANWTEAAFRENQDFVMFLFPLQIEQQRSFEKIWQTIVSESL